MVLRNPSEFRLQCRAALLLRGSRTAGFSTARLLKCTRNERKGQTTRPSLVRPPAIHTMTRQLTSKQVQRPVAHEFEHCWEPDYLTEPGNLRNLMRRKYIYTDSVPMQKLDNSVAASTDYILACKTNPFESKSLLPPTVRFNCGAMVQTASTMRTIKHDVRAFFR